MLNNRPPHTGSHTSPSVPPSSTGGNTEIPYTPQPKGSSGLLVSSAALLRGHKTVDIAHNGMLYTLQATKLGKLILTK